MKLFQLKLPLLDIFALQLYHDSINFAPQK